MRKLCLLPLLFVSLTCNDGDPVQSLEDLDPVFASSPSGPVFTVFNPYVEPVEGNKCNLLSPNCTVFGAKEFVWLKGDPVGGTGMPDGEYFFAVLVPGGNQDPNDGGTKNLSDDYGAYTKRAFTVTGGHISDYDGDHWLDSGATIDPNRDLCVGVCEPDGNPPFIRLFPFADTWNVGGGYQLAVCSLENGYPVKPRDCGFGIFTIKP